MPRRRTTANSLIDNTASKPKTLGECNLELLEKQELCDVFFIVGNERIGCHKLFLMSRSVVFQSMFAERWDKDGKSEVKIVDFGIKAFKSFLKFIYADQFVDTISEAVELLALADKYDVPLLMDKCKELMQSQITLKDSINVYQVARKYNLLELQKSACELMTSNFSELAKLHCFKSQADEDTVTAIIKQDELSTNELEVFQAIMRWKAAKKISEASLKNIIQHVRFPLMSPDEFSTHVVPTKVLTNDEVISIFMCFHANTKARSNLTSKFSSVPRWIPADFLIDFYNASQQRQQIQVSAETISSHQETMRFQYVMQYSVEKLSICSVILKGPNPMPTSTTYISSPIVPTNKETWQVTVTVKNANSTSIQSATSVFEKSNVTISNMAETTVVVHPSVQLVHGSYYYILVKYQSPVGLTTVQDGYYNTFNPHNFRTIVQNPTVSGYGYVKVSNTGDEYGRSSTHSTYCIRKIGFRKSS